MSPKVNDTLRTLDRRIGVVIRVSGEHVWVRVSKNVKKIRLSIIAKSGYDLYDYFQLNTQKLPDEQRKPVRFPLRPRIDPSANPNLPISQKTLNRALAAFKKYATIILNIHKRDIYVIQKELDSIISPFLKKGFIVEGYIEGRDRFYSLKRGSKTFKTYKLPMKDRGVNHGKRQCEKNN